MGKIDVIIILGGGIDEQGKISKITKERLNGFLKEKNKFIKMPILLSSRWSGLMEIKPKITEAQAMKKYLIANGISASRFYSEDKSLDTVSNAIFSREIVAKHKNWKRILLVTSGWHMRRASWLFKEVFGHSYQIVVFPAMSEEKNMIRNVQEVFLLAISKRIWKKIQSSNKKITEALLEFHPFYSKSSRIKKILKKVIPKRKELFT